MCRNPETENTKTFTKVQFVNKPTSPLKHHTRKLRIPLWSNKELQQKALKVQETLKLTTQTQTNSQIHPLTLDFQQEIFPNFYPRRKRENHDSCYTDFIANRSVYKKKMICWIGKEKKKNKSLGRSIHSQLKLTESEMDQSMRV